MHQSYYDVVSLDYDVIVLLSEATRQLVVSIHYAAQSAARRYANNRLRRVSPSSASLLLQFRSSLLSSTSPSVYKLYCSRSSNPTCPLAFTSHPLHVPSVKTLNKGRTSQYSLQ